MKHIFFLLILSLSCHFSFAKKVKFAVDMTGQIVDSLGVHISGDFQDEAGYPADWESGTTELIQSQADTNIYSIVVDIPAFQKYEFKFVNGTEFYQVEFVPIPSRVGYFFNDNRWIWVDSLADDTTFVGAIPFNGNAPAGLTLLRVVVDMQNEATIAPEGVHVAGDFQGWNTEKTMLYSFGNDIYEIIAYMSNGEHQFKYYNGNTTTTSENVPIACALNNNRNVSLNQDTILTTVCFSGCSACITSSIGANLAEERAYIYPNPSTEATKIHFQDSEKSHNFSLVDASGKKLRQYKNVIESDFYVDKENLTKGVYFILIENKKSAPTVLKWLIK